MQLRACVTTRAEPLSVMLTSKAPLLISGVHRRAFSNQLLHSFKVTITGSYPVAVGANKAVSDSVYGVYIATQQQLHMRARKPESNVDRMF
eukprot:6172-Heterococcus_DN1.PRE.1